MARRISGKILVVDDDKNIRSLCAEVLGAAGYDVITSTHGEDALKELDAGRFALVITDVAMPSVEGMGFYLCATKRHPYLKDRFLFMTNRLTRPLRKAMTRLDSECLVKPFKIKDLLGLLDRLMAEDLENMARRKGKGERHEWRFCPGAECVVFVEGRCDKRILMARARDISRNGLNISFSGEIHKGADVNVIINLNHLNLHRTARVIWVKGEGDKATAGLKLNEPLPVSSLINVYQGSDEVSGEGHKVAL